MTPNIAEEEKKLLKEVVERLSRNLSKNVIARESRLVGTPVAISNHAIRKNNIYPSQKKLLARGFDIPLEAP